MDEKNLKKMALTFHMLSNPNRLRMLYLCFDQSVSVGDLVNRLRLSQSLVSHHLKQLREAGLIQAERQGKNMLYQVQDQRVRCILNDMLLHSNSMKNGD